MKLLYLAIAYMSGIVLGRFAWEMDYVNCQSAGSWLWIVLLLLLPIPFLLDDPTRLAPSAMRWPAVANFERPLVLRSYAFYIALCLTLMCGALRYMSHPITPCWTTEDLAFYNLPADDAYNKNAPQVTVRGYVSSYPLFEDTEQKMNVWVTSIIPVDGTNAIDNIEGEVTFKTSNAVAYAYGQPVEMIGRLTTPNDFEDFSYREYLARKNVHSLFNLQGNGTITLLDEPNQGTWYLRAIYAVRTRGELLINRILPEPYSGLANGMLLGIEAGIDDDLYEKFNLTGTSHVIVISGSNVAIIAAVFLAIGTRLVGRRRAMWPALIGIGCYALLVGGDGAVMRAALMGAVYVVATSLGRRNTALVSLAFACWVLTLVNPLTLWDVGFQLSSAATAGLILYANRISDFFTHWTRAIWAILVGKFRQKVRRSLPNQDYIAPASQKSSELMSADNPLLASTVSTSTVLTSTKSFMGGLIQEGLLITIAANITTLPLVVYYFERLSVVSLLTNLLISAAQPYIMLWGSAALVLGIVGSYLHDWSVFMGISGIDLTQFADTTNSVASMSIVSIDFTALFNRVDHLSINFLALTERISQLVMSVPLLCLMWTVEMVEWTAVLPGASLLIEWYELKHLIATYLLLGIHLRLSTLPKTFPLLIMLRRFTLAAKQDLRNSFKLPWRMIAEDSSGFITVSNALLLAVACLLVWMVMTTLPDGKLHVYFLDIGQGDGLFIQTPSGRQVLIDGGESPQRLFNELGEVMPFWDRTIDLVILSHPDGDHMFAQIDLPTRFDVDMALETKHSLAKLDSVRWRKAMQAAGVVVQRHQAGDWIDLGDGVSFETIWPPPEGYRGLNEDNENSIVAKLVYGEFSVLLTGDAGLPSEEAWLADGIDLSATVLKVGHHGSRGSTGSEFVAAVDPDIAVIQVGENKYGHPNQEVLDNLAGRKVFCNTEHGRMHIYSNGHSMTITEERAPDAVCRANYSEFTK